MRRIGGLWRATYLSREGSKCGTSAGPLPSRPAVPAGLSPDENSPVDCFRLAKGRASVPGASCKDGATYPSREGLQ